MHEIEEAQVLSLGWKDPLEKEMATCSSILAWEMPWTAEPGGLQSMGLQRVGHDWTHYLVVPGLTGVLGIFHCSIPTLSCGMRDPVPPSAKRFLEVPRAQCFLLFTQLCPTLLRPHGL